MYHIIYVSTASHLMDQAELTVLLAGARAFNQSHEITGVLLYKDGSFVQILEGEKECLKSLYKRICNDPRHHGVITISEGDTTQREFSEWAMGFREITGSNLSLIPGFTAYINSPYQDDPFLTQSERYKGLLEMFKGIL